MKKCRCNSQEFSHIHQMVEKERFDKKVKHEALNESTLLMEPWDWEKFDGPPVIGNGYFYAVKSLGDVKNKRVLEAGCGTGWLSVILAKRGAQVFGFDISPESIRIAQKRAQVNKVENNCTFSVKSFYDLDYEENFFDLAIGCAILHHVNIDKIIEPLQRVLKPEGRAIFFECFGNSRWLERLRLLIPIPVSEIDKSHWQEQLTYSDLRKFFKGFEKVSWREFQLFSRLDRVIKNESFIRLVNLFDEIILHSFPILKRYARTVVLNAEIPLKKATLPTSNVNQG